MSYYFIDSSALVKRYVVETGTNWIRSITALSAGNTIMLPISHKLKLFRV